MRSFNIEICNESLIDINKLSDVVIGINKDLDNYFKSLKIQIKSVEIDENITFIALCNVVDVCIKLELSFKCFNETEAKDLIKATTAVLAQKNINMLKNKEI